MRRALPEIVGIIFDEDHFRVDLFVNPKWLRLIKPSEQIYLSDSKAPLSLTSSTGLALSGSNGTSPTYNFQNQTILGFKNARIRADTSYATVYGFVVDTMVGEIDRPGIRYSAGLFWAPGIDLTGQRRIVGAGFGTQFDTRTDRDALRGTPLVVFLAQPARIDILVDGRLVSSRAYEAGNNIIDTASLPDGSYSLVLQIHDASGGVHAEQRFFAKNPQIAPIGEPIYFGYAGLLANTEPGRPISVSKDLFYQIGTERRLSNALALDFSVIGTSNRPLVEAGGWLITALARVRAAALLSPQGDKGALLQIASAQTGRFSLNFDIRRIWSHDGQPLIPLPTYINTFESVPLDQQQIGTGSLTQASGSIGYQLGSAFLEVIGTLRKDQHVPVDYSIGPNLNWPLVNAHGLQIALQANAQVTRATTAGYLGVRMFLMRGRFSVSSSAGARELSTRGNGGSSLVQAVGDTNASVSYSGTDGTDASLDGGLTRDIGSTTAHADAEVYSRFGSARGEVLHDFTGNNTQYGLSLQTGAVINRNDIAFGGRNLEESALVVSVEGASDGSEFDVLIDNHPHGRLKAGQHLPIFLEPYRAYSVRLRALNAASVWYDTAAREFTLYPGNVQHVGWHVEHVLTLFGRAVRNNGVPVTNATITSRRGMGESNADGYFQVEASAVDSLSFNTGAGEACTVKISKLNQKLDYASVGKVLCQ